MTEFEDSVENVIITKRPELAGFTVSAWGQSQPR